VKKTDVPVFDVVVETPKGSRNKYELDHKQGVFRLDREMFSATRFPIDYGFVEGTLAEDGDPLDALVLVGEPTFPGCRIECRTVGLLRMHDQQGRDDKLLCVPAWDARLEWRDLKDVPKPLLDEIGHFFQIYKDLDRKAWAEVDGWSGRARAEEELAAARRRA
jgi:inorganic pyrophosphatase